MPINLEDHKFFEYQRKMDVVPYSIAVKALEEAKDQQIAEINEQVEKALATLQQGFTELNKTVESIND